MQWHNVREDRKAGGLIYSYPCGHEYLMTKADVLAYVKDEGLNAPASCPICGETKVEV